MAVEEGDPFLKLESLSSLLLFLAPALVLGAHFCLEKPVPTQTTPLHRRCRVLGFAHTAKACPFPGKENNLSSFSLTPSALGQGIKEKALG